MEFFHENDIPSRARRDVTFRYPARRGFLVFLLLAWVLGGVYMGLVPGLQDAQIRTAAAAAAVLMLVLAVLRAASGPSRRVGWLVRMTDAGLLVRFRSHLNHRTLSRDDVVAFRVPWNEIAWAIPAGGAEHGGRLTHVEMKLRSYDLLPLKMHLANERTRKAPDRRRWSGRKMSLVAHFPVQLMPDGVLRLEWKVRPRPKRAVDLLRRRIGGLDAPDSPRPPEGADRPLGPVVERDPLEQILSLARSGDMMGAFLAAADAFGLAEAEAEKLVEALASGEITPENPKAVTAFLLKAVSRERLLKWAERGEVKSVEGALMRDYGFNLAEATSLGREMAELSPDKARGRLEEVLAQRPLRQRA